MSISKENKHTVHTIRELVEICRDSERGYKSASEKVEDAELKTILYRLSQQRALFRGELEENLIKDFGVEAKQDDSLVSKLHRGWMDFKAGLSGKNTKAVLEECEKGEKHAIEKYSDALKENLPGFIEDRVKEQLSMIKGTLSQLREFEAEVLHS